MTTVELRAWPLGKDGEVSYGGTALMKSGRERPTRFLLNVVALTDTAAAPQTRMIGRHVRFTQVSHAVRMLARIGIPMLPPMFVKPVTAAFSPGVRRSSARAKAGLSRFASPASSTTLSYTSAPRSASTTTIAPPTSMVIHRAA